MAAQCGIHLIPGPLIYQYRIDTCIACPKLPHEQCGWSADRCITPVAQVAVADGVSPGGQPCSTPRCSFHTDVTSFSGMPTGRSREMTDQATTTMVSLSLHVLLLLLISQPCTPKQKIQPRTLTITIDVIHLKHDLELSFTFGPGTEACQHLHEIPEREQEVVVNDVLAHKCSSCVLKMG